MKMLAEKVNLPANTASIHQAAEGRRIFVLANPATRAAETCFSFLKISSSESKTETVRVNEIESSCHSTKAREEKHNTHQRVCHG